MGQSAGAMSIMYMMYGEKLKGLVQGAIMLSGGGLIPKIAGPIHRKDAKEFWENVSKEVFPVFFCDSSDLCACLFHFFLFYFMIDHMAA